MASCLWIDFRLEFRWSTWSPTNTHISALLWHGIELRRTTGHKMTSASTLTSWHPPLGARHSNNMANVPYLRTSKKKKKKSCSWLIACAHDVSCEKISLETLSKAIYYCEDGGCLGEEPQWRTQRPLTNSQQKGVSAQLLKTSDLLWHWKSPHSCQGALIALPMSGCCHSPLWCAVPLKAPFCDILVTNDN